MMEARVIQSGQRDSITARSRRRDFLELFLIYALILLVLWTPSPWQLLLWGVALALMMAITCTTFDGLETMGLRRTNFHRSLWAVGVALAVATVAVALAFRLHTLQLPASPARFVSHYGAYAIWALVQQLGLQCFFLSRLLRLLPGEIPAAGMAAVLFAIAHLPSPILMLATLIWGFLACLLFVRYRNLYSLAIAHAILGIAIGITIPATVDHNMLVGLRYTTYMQNPTPTSPIPPRPLSQP